jgi:hypothetical protein
MSLLERVQRSRQLQLGLAITPADAAYAQQADRRTVEAETRQPEWVRRALTNSLRPKELTRR